MQILGQIWMQFNSLISELAEEDLNCWFCDEDDIEEVLESRGHNVTVMSYQELDQLIIDLRETAVYDFNRASNKQPVLLVKN